MKTDRLENTDTDGVKTDQRIQHRWCEGRSENTDRPEFLSLPVCADNLPCVYYLVVLLAVQASILQPVCDNKLFSLLLPADV